MSAIVVIAILLAFAFVVGSPFVILLIAKLVRKVARCCKPADVEAPPEPPIEDALRDARRDVAALREQNTLLRGEIEVLESRHALEHEAATRTIGEQSERIEALEVDVRKWKSSSGVLANVCQDYANGNRPAMAAMTDALRNVGLRVLELVQPSQPTPALEDSNVVIVAPCIVCFDAKVDTAVVPCGHTFCRACIDRPSTDRCPYCRQAIDELQPMYLNTVE